MKSTCIKTLQIYLLLSAVLFNSPLRADTRDSLCIDPPVSYVDEPVQVRSYVTIANCCTPVDSASVQTNLHHFYWFQTQCSDPWYTGLGETNEETTDSLKSFLRKEGVEPRHISFTQDPDMAEACDACTCLTGTTIFVWTDAADSTVMTELGFTTGTDTLFEFVTAWHTDAFPQCDCYCQCADTVQLGTLDLGPHRLIFTTLYYYPYEKSGWYGSSDSLEFEVLENATYTESGLNDEQTRIYPNPTTGDLILPEALSGSVFILSDSQGRVLDSGEVVNTFLSLSGITPGLVFMLFMREGRIILSQPLVIQNPVR